MKRCYCKECGFSYGEPREALCDFNPDICTVRGSPVDKALDSESGSVSVPFREYQTVGQWELFHGRTYPDSAPVYYKDDDGWHLREYGAVSGLPGFSPLVVATELGAPSKDWTGVVWA